MSVVRNGATSDTAEVTRKRHNWAMAELAVGDYERLRLLEDSLWRAETRFDRDYMERILDPDFSEF